MKKMFVFDIDGTLIEKGTRKLPDSTVKSLKIIHNKGAILTIASGRPFFSLDLNVINRISFDYYICSNGGSILTKTKKELIQYGIPRDILDKLISDVILLHCGLSLHFSDATYIYADAEKVIAFRKQYLGDKKDSLKNLVDITQSRDRHLKSLPTSGVMHIPSEYLLHFQNLYPMLEFVHVKGNYYDVIIRGVDKANAVKKLSEYLHLDLNDVVAFGDDCNDVTMLQTAGIGIAMGGAAIAAKESADYVTSDIMDGGVSKALSHLGFL